MYSIQSTLCIQSINSIVLTALFLLYSRELSAQDVKNINKKKSL